MEFFGLYVWTYLIYILFWVYIYNSNQQKDVDTWQKTLVSKTITRDRISSSGLSLEAQNKMKIFFAIQCSFFFGKIQAIIKRFIFRLQTILTIYWKKIFSILQCWYVFWKKYFNLFLYHLKWCLSGKRIFPKWHEYRKIRNQSICNLN